MFDPTTPYKRKGRGTMIIKIEYELEQVLIDTTDAPITAMELVGVLEMAKQMVIKKVSKLMTEDKENKQANTNKGQR